MPVSASRPLSLREGFDRCQMTCAQLHVQQLALGGDLGCEELEAAIFGLLTVSDLEYDVVALALNEHLTGHGDEAQVGYRTM